MGTGEAEVVELGPMVRKGEVAWLHKRDMPGSEPAAGRASQQQSPNSPQQAGSKKRKVPWLTPHSALLTSADIASAEHEACVLSAQAALPLY